jgi:hypothetical protein
MISGIEVGRQVVCVDAKPRKPPYQPLGIYEKAIYTICSLGPGPSSSRVKTHGALPAATFISYRDGTEGRSRMGRRLS